MKYSAPNPAVPGTTLPEDFPTTHKLVQGDTVLDPFCGTGTTMVAALKSRRHSIGIELDTEYCRMAASRLINENSSLFSHAELQIQLHGQPDAQAQAALHETPPAYSVKTKRNAQKGRTN